MHKLKPFIKKYAMVLKDLVSVFYDTFVCFCKKVIPVIFSNTVVFLKRWPRVFAVILTVIVISSCTVTVVLATGTTSAYAVVCGGETIAMVKDSSILAEAQNFAINKINNPDCTSSLINPQLIQTIAGEKNLISSNELAECIISHSKDIVLANVLKVDGKIVASGNSYDEIDSLIKSYLSNQKKLIKLN